MYAVEIRVSEFMVLLTYFLQFIVREGRGVSPVENSCRKHPLMATEHCRWGDGLAYSVGWVPSYLIKDGTPSHCDSCMPSLQFRRKPD